jgi:rhodanese-related sulfurtransferase
MNLKLISPQVLHAMLADSGELALIDVREELIFSQAHLFFARSIPLSRLELNFARLVPRRSTRIVLCDEDDGLAQRAARVLFAAGYSDVGVLHHGIRGWSDAGFQRPEQGLRRVHRACRCHAQYRGRRAQSNDQGRR